MIQVKPYSNIINFSGHSHFPIIDERSIWQKEFTAIQTGSTSYVELETAFRVANRFYSDEEFNENVTDVYIPNINYITELRKMYTTVNSRSNKL